jgi:hypothetical protein
VRGWNRQYLSVQRERPYRESFEAAGTHLVILHLDGPVTVRRGLDETLRRWEPAARTYVDQLGSMVAAQLVRRHGPAGSRRAVWRTSLPVGWAAASSRPSGH